MSSGKIFTMVSPVKVGVLEIDSGKKHLVAVYDADGNPRTTGDQDYIEAFPEGSSFTGNLVVQANDTIDGHLV